MLAEIISGRCPASTLVYTCIRLRLGYSNKVKDGGYQFKHPGTKSSFWDLRTSHT